MRFHEDGRLLTGPENSVPSRSLRMLKFPLLPLPADKCAEESCRMCPKPGLAKSNCPASDMFAPALALVGLWKRMETVLQLALVDVARLRSKLLAESITDAEAAKPFDLTVDPNAEAVAVSGANAPKPVSLLVSVSTVLTPSLFVAIAVPL